jgi:septal ring factor EnvC (AmiA/AmiB activator)
MYAVLLTVLSAIVAVAFLLVLAVCATRVAETLESIGAREPSPKNNGSMSFLAKISLGVRAIEGQCIHLGKQVTDLNRDLKPLAEGLIAIQDRLATVRQSIDKQQG